MANFGETYRGGRNLVTCPLCDNGHPDSQERSFECKKVKSVLNIQDSYETIFNSESSDLPRIAKILSRIMKLRNKNGDI